MSSFGYRGKVLHVDLIAQQAWIEEPDDRLKYPERFAAIVPIASGGDPEKACALKDVPVWAFHGAKDDVVLPEESEEMVKALKACGDVRFTLYPDAYHDSWTQTYDNPELYEWLLRHTLTESPER